MNRRVAAAAMLALLAITAGCAALGGGEVDRERLKEDANYDWDTTDDVTITVEGDTYTAILDVENRSELTLFRFYRLNEKRPLELSAVRFRYPNGTVVGPEAMAFEQSRSGTTITLPAEEGKLAYTAPKRGKRVRVATVIDGSYEVVLPPDADVQYFLLGRVSPGGHERTVEDGRVHVRWDEISDDRLVVRYYLARDLWLFGGLTAVSAIVLVAGSVFFYFQLRRLQAQRESVALDVDDDSGPS